MVKFWYSLCQYSWCHVILPMFRPYLVPKPTPEPLYLSVFNSISVGFGTAAVCYLFYRKSAMFPKNLESGDLHTDRVHPHGPCAAHPKNHGYTVRVPTIRTVYDSYGNQIRKWKPTWFENRLGLVLKGVFREREGDPEKNISIFCTIVLCGG